MILEKYQHIKTPQTILDELEQVRNTEKASYRSMDFRQYTADQSKPRAFLKDALSYRNEVGKPSNVIPFNTYFPTFETMDGYRKDFYFYWRSEVSKGNFLPTELSYIFLFSYELVNYGFSSDAAYNVSMLEQLYRHYVYRYPKLEKYLPNWIVDFLLELGEEALVSEWVTDDIKENKEYNELKLYSESIHAISMTIWWRYITERSRSPFFAKEKQKVYVVFKEAILFLHQSYLSLHKEGILEQMFPVQQVVLERQLFASCLLDRQVSVEHMKVERRQFDPQFGLFLSEIMRICENQVRKRQGIEERLPIRPDRISDERQQQLIDYLNERERTSCFKKVGGSPDQEKGTAIPQAEEKVEIVLDFERIETLNEESQEFQQLYEEKYGEDLTEPDVALMVAPERVSFLEQVLPAQDTEDTTTFIASLSATEREFLIRLQNESITIEQTKAFLKTKGMMIGNFLIELNEKAEEHLGDILLEEAEDVFEITEEFLFIFEDL